MKATLILSALSHLWRTRRKRSKRATKLFASLSRRSILESGTSPTGASTTSGGLMRGRDTTALPLGARKISSDGSRYPQEIKLTAGGRGEGDEGDAELLTQPAALSALYAALDRVHAAQWEGICVGDKAGGFDPWSGRFFAHLERALLSRIKERTGNGNH